MKVRQKALYISAGAGAAALGTAALVSRLRLADLGGQVALIGGGSRGLGFLLAREFARQGCRLAICARDEQELERPARTWCAAARRCSRCAAMSATANRCATLSTRRASASD